MTEIDVVRHSHLIDPHLHIWQWQVPLYLFLGGLAAGVMFLTALQWLVRPYENRSNWLRWSVFLAPAVLSIGMLALLLDLEYKSHVWRFYTAFRPTSPMSWGAWILLLIYPVTLGFGAGTLSSEECEWLTGRRLVRALRLEGMLNGLITLCRRHVNALAWLSLLLGVALGGYTGILLGVFVARPLWNAAVLGPLFFASGLSTGAAAIMLMPLKPAEYRFVQRWDMVAIVAELGIIGLMFLDLLANGGAAGRAAAQLLLGGPYTAAFWAIVVVTGLILPLAMEALELSRHLPRLWLTPVLILVAGFALRWILVYAGQA